MCEYHLNCLEYTWPNCLKIQSCFLGGASRQIVADFIVACDSAAGCSLWTRITTLVDALHVALHSIYVATGGDHSLCHPWLVRV